MFKSVIHNNSEFLLGALFGMLIVPLADFVWHIFWNYLIPDSWAANMNEPWPSIIKFLILFVIALAVLLVYYKTKRNEKNAQNNTKKTEAKMMTDTPIEQNQLIITVTFRQESCYA